MMRPRFFLPMAERERLLDRLRAQVEREAEVEFATVFGSFLDPELPFADIDVGLGLAPGADPTATRSIAPLTGLSPWVILWMWWFSPARRWGCRCRS
jgi:hypothetical protein